MSPHATSKPLFALPTGWTASVFADELSADLDEQLAEVHRSGLTHFDLRSAFGKNVLDLTNEEVQQVSKAAQRYGLGINAIGSPINKHPFDPAGRECELERLKRIIEIARILQVRRIRMFSPFVSGGIRAPEYAEIRDWLAEQIELARTAEVMFIHENDADAFGAFPANAQRLLGDLHSPYFRAVFDFSNAVILGYPALPHWFPWIIPYLDSLHIKDGISQHAENYLDQIALPGKGEGRMKETLELLVRSGWKGPITFEPHLFKMGERENLSGIETFRVAVATLNELFLDMAR